MAFVRRTVSLPQLFYRQPFLLLPRNNNQKLLCSISTKTVIVDQSCTDRSSCYLSLRKLTTCHCMSPVSSFLQPSQPLNVVSKRFYAKKKDKGGKGKKGVKRSSLTDEELTAVISYGKMITQMDDVIENLKQDFIKQLSLRSNLSSFETLIVETEDGKFPLKQVAQIAQKGANTITINCGAMIQYLPAIKTALEKSGMNINPQMDKNTIFVPIPKVTREYRESLVKSAKTLSDRSKAKLKDLHNKYQRDAKKRSDVSEDLVRNVVETIHDKLHEYQALCDDLMKKKQEELLPK